MGGFLYYWLYFTSTDLKAGLQIDLAQANHSSCLRNTLWLVRTLHMS